MARTKSEIADEALGVDLIIELIETVIIYNLPRLTREEIRTMLQIHDIRQSHVYQDARAEGRTEGIAIAIAKLVAEKKSAMEIATILGLDVDLVRRAMATTEHN